jgi:hypothetical protein
MRVMGVAAARFESNRSLTKSAGLALRAKQAFAVVDDEIAARVLAERQE